MSEEFEFKLPISLRTDEPVAVEPVIVPDVKVAPVEASGNDLLGDTIKPVVSPANDGLDIDLLGDAIPPIPDTPVDEFEMAATELELELPEGATKWDAKLIASQAKVKIEESRQVLNLDDYDPEVKILFRYIQENGGSMIGLATDPVIRQLNELTMYDSEYFYRTSMGMKLKDTGFSDANIENQIETLIDQVSEEDREEFFEKYHKEAIKMEINPLINERITELNTEKESYRSRLKLIQDGNDEKINKRMEQTVNDLTDMTGIEFSAKNKEIVLSRLKSGDIQKEIAKDPGCYQLLGYLHKQTDPKRTEIWKDLLLNQGRSQYHAGVSKILNHAYGSDKDKGGSSSASGDVVLNDWKKLGTR